MHLDPLRLARRINGREQAQAIVSLLNLDHPDKVAAFMDELRSRFEPKVVEAEQKSKKRRLSELLEFRLKFGQHAGMALDEVPRDYLEWMVEDGQETIDAISEYLSLTGDETE